MTSALKERLSDWIVEYLRAERTFGAVEGIIKAGKDKTVYDDFALDAFWSMVAGVILSLCKTDEDLRVILPVGAPPCGTCGKGIKSPKPGPIGKLLKANLGDMRRDAWKNWPTEEPWLADVHREDYEPVFDRLFPDVADRGDVSPTVADLAGYSDRVSAAVQPIRDHRNTLIAHRAKKPKPAKFDDIRKAFCELKGLLRDLYLVATAGTGMSMTLGGGANPARFAEAFVSLMVGDGGGVVDGEA